jgi:hypothetical protein
MKEYYNLKNIGNIRLTEDGKYMLCSYGNDMGDESAIKESMGVRIYNFDDLQLLIDIKFNTGFQPNNHFTRGNLFVISSTKWDEEKQDKYEIVHFEDRMIYTIVLPRSTKVRLKEINKEGFTFRNPDVSKDDIKLYFKKDFMSEGF